MGSKRSLWSVSEKIQFLGLTLVILSVGYLFFQSLWVTAGANRGGAHRRYGTLESELKLIKR